MASEDGRRGVSARGGGDRAAFSRAGRAATYAGKGSDVSIETASMIIRSADEVRSRVTAHHAKRVGDMTNKRYGDLLGKHGLDRAPMPTWAASDPQAKLMARARTSVASDLQQRLARVDRAQANMLKSGQVRATRKVAWGKGLGE